MMYVQCISAVIAPWLRCENPDSHTPKYIKAFRGFSPLSNGLLGPHSNTELLPLAPPLNGVLGCPAMTVMIDSVTGNAPPLASPIVAGYVDGSYGPNDKFGTGWSAAAWDRYRPRSQLVTITTGSSPGARVADCEPGAMTIPATVNWCLEEIAHGRRPTGYADQYDWERAFGLDQALAKAGIPRPVHVDGWIAHRGAPAVVPPGFVAIQFAQSVLTTPYGPTSHAVDISQTNGVWPGMAPPPPLTPSPSNQGVLLPMIKRTSTGHGYWVCDPSGAVFAFGDAKYFGGCNPGASSPMPPGHSATGFDALPNDLGYWISTDFGGVYSFGYAVYYGAPNNLPKHLAPPNIPPVHSLPPQP